MRCIICDGWSPDIFECDFCNAPVCEDCIIDDDTGEFFYSEECQLDNRVN